jgi:hypothetical protein
MKMRMTATIVALTFMQISLFASNGVDIRFTPASYDNSSHTLYVDIQVRAQDNQLVLAGQNYRIYYNSEALTLNKDKAKLQLPSEKYSELKFHSLQENIDARGAGTLQFDKNLGFANFSVDLKDQEFGGISLSSLGEWHSVATLEFKVNREENDYQLVWGREEISQDYATAYVEMAEWIAPKKIRSLNINEYGDYSSISNNNEIELTATSMTFLPNPSQDFVQISFDQQLINSSQVIVRDLAGRQLLLQYVDALVDKVVLDISEIPSGNYIVEVRSKNQTLIVSENLVKM